LTDEQIEEGWCACGGGNAYEAWKAAVRWAEQQHLAQPQPKAAEVHGLPDLAFQLLAAANYIEALGGDAKSYRAAIEAFEAQPKGTPLGYLSEHTGPEGPFKWQFSKTLAGVYRDTALRIIPVYEPGIQSPAPAHRWDDVGERCVKCGDKDWMGGPCSVPDIPDHAVEINRLRNVIQAACTGGLDHMIERWKELFPDAPVPTVHAVPCAAVQDERAICEILASIWFYGQWVAETANEREIEARMRRVGLWPTTEQEIVERSLARERSHVPVQGSQS